MKKISVFAALLLLSVGCRGPKIIPDEELAQIFHDIYLVNGYVSQNGLDVDTLNIYEPVFARHGYTSEDIQYTIGNFAKRKSARLSDDVVEVAASMLRRESRYYRRRIEIRDTIALVARNRYADTIYFDSLIRVRRVSDTARLRVVLDDIRPGSYEVSFGYLVDSLDRNTGLRANSWLIDEKGRRSGGNVRRFMVAQHAKISSTLTATGDHRKLVIDMNGYGKNLTTPRLTIDSLRVIYRLPDEVAVDRLTHSWMDYRTLDTLINRHETSFVAPLADTPGAGER